MLAKKSDATISGRFLPSVSPLKMDTGVGEIARPVHYRANGSGRDSYIVSTDGGFTHPNKPCDPREVFRSTLRNYGKNDTYLQSRNYDLANLGAGSVFRRNSLVIMQ